MNIRISAHEEGRRVRVSEAHAQMEAAQLDLAAAENANAEATKAVNLANQQLHKSGQVLVDKRNAFNSSMATWSAAVLGR